LKPCPAYAHSEGSTIKLKRDFQKILSWIKYLIYLMIKKDIIERFHELYYDSFSKTWGKTLWLGIHAAKCPLDLWIYQEIIFELKPDIIVECGTGCGGSSLFLASICDMIDKGRVITIDIEDKEGRPQHKRITYLLGSSTSEDIVEQVRKLISPKDKVMVSLDSAHDKDHVLEELRIYSRLVTRGSYIIVEDTNLSGHPVVPTDELGPMEAVEEFLKDNKGFVIDKTREKFYLSFNPNGYLKKIDQPTNQSV